jgi:hypothetical protein
MRHQYDIEGMQRGGCVGKVTAMAGAMLILLQI